MFFKKDAGGVGWLLVCLGNPGDKYENTRHNVGFMVADEVAGRQNKPLQRLKFKALTNILTISGEKVLVMKPITYMNLSGEAVRQAADFYKIPPERVLVVSDDTALAVGRLRIRMKGSAGGHNGLKSIIQHLGTDQFPRLRVGVGEKPHPDYDLADWVLGKFVGTRVSSTCELLFTVIREIWGVEAITGEVANALYTGINTDTGGLNHNSSRPETYLVIARLLELGLNKAYVHENLYQHNRLSRLRLVGNSLLNKLTIHPVYPVALIPISKEELEKYDYKEGDLEGLVNIPLSVENVLVSIQITQRKERVKLSFRSKGDIPVNAWAKEHFNGGGHLNAAGGQSSMPLQQVVQKVRDTAAWFFDRYLPEHRPE